MNENDGVHRRAMPKIGFITNFCPHYRVRTFELLAQQQDVEFMFFSAGDEWYVQKLNGTFDGSFKTIYLAPSQKSSVRRAWDIARVLLRSHYDVVIKCINNPSILAASFVIAKILRRPFILWSGIWARVDTTFHRLMYPFTRFIYRHADAVVVYGTHGRDYLVSEGVAPERIFCAWNAVDNRVYSAVVTEQDQAAVRARYEIEAQDRVVLFVGRLEEGKGLDYLLDSFAAVSRSVDDVVLVIAGDGSLRESLENRAHEQGIAHRVRFVRHVPVHETVKLYAIAYTYVLPSVTTPTFKEPWGLVVNEAFGQGVPVIATDAVGAAVGGLLRDGENGIVVPERDVAALAGAMLRLLRDAELRSRMSKAASELIATWTQERMAQGFIDAIRFVLRRSRMDPASAHSSADADRRSHAG
jgi:glycosyltransferase involved in cell wall biosynthesis